MPILKGSHHPLGERQDLLLKTNHQHEAKSGFWGGYRILRKSCPRGQMHRAIPSWDWPRRRKKLLLDPHLPYTMSLTGGSNTQQQSTVRERQEHGRRSIPSLMEVSRDKLTVSYWHRKKLRQPQATINGIWRLQRTKDNHWNHEVNSSIEWLHLSH